MWLKAFVDLPPRKRMGLIAILLGIIAAASGVSPYDKTRTNVNLKKMALISETDIASIKSEELADWIIEQKSDFRLIDLRTEDDYNAYNIPLSENIPTDQLLKSDLKRNEKILLYSDNDIISTQAWFILTADNFKSVKVLKGGIEMWKNHVVFPVCACGENPSEEGINEHNRKTEIAKFFGGEIQSAGNNIGEIKRDLPKLTAPVKTTLTKSRKKKTREGC